MDKFLSPEQSHAHSLSILNQLLEYDSWLGDITTVADMGCGTGLDISWWANLKSRDDPPQPHNYRCFAVDKNATTIKSVAPGISTVVGDFTTVRLPASVDLIWSHDSFQFSTRPFETLANWNRLLSANGMLCLIVPQSPTVLYNKWSDVSFSGVYHHYTITNLIYMLAVSGFDCSKMYAIKQYNDPWIQIILRKSKTAILDPDVTSWYDLLDMGLLDPSASASVLDYGYLRSEDLLLPWLNCNLYRIDHQISLETMKKPTLPGPIFRLADDGPRVLKRKP